MAQLTLRQLPVSFLKLGDFQCISRSLCQYAAKIVFKQESCRQYSTYRHWPRHCYHLSQEHQTATLWAFSESNSDFLIIIGEIRDSFMSTRTYATKTPRKEPKAKKGGKPKVILTDEEMSQVIDISSLQDHFLASIEKLKESYIKHLSLRTSVGSIESLIIPYEGEDYPLNQIAQVVRKNPNLLVVNLVSLPGAIPIVLDSLDKSGMNLNPQQEGTTIYIPIPQITREHRETLAKNAKVLFNKCKEELQDIQNKAIKSVKSKKGNFSEDLIFNVQQQIMSMTTSHVAQAEHILSQKEEDLLKVK